MTQPSPLPWSYSKLDSFETCPKQFYHLKVARDVPDRKNESALWGDRVHNHLAARLLDNTPLPPSIAGYEKIVIPIAVSKGEKIIESKLAVDADLRPTGWWDKNTWFRGIVDVGIFGRSRAALFDWKTGRRKPGGDQLQLFAGLAFSYRSTIQTVRTAYVWLKEGKVDPAIFTRDRLGEVWSPFYPRVARMEAAYTRGDFPARPSGLCAKHCPVPRSKCVHSGTR